LGFPLDARADAARKPQSFSRTWLFWLRGLALEWQASELVEWLGHVEDMPAVLAGADIVAVPSYREGLPKS
jgi:hypothetical protein